MPEVSPLRLNLLRAYYLLILVERGVRVLPALAGGGLGPFDGTAYAFWGALALLAALGLRHPLAMLPLLLIHLAYKSLWLAAVALPLWTAGVAFDPLMTAFAWAMAVGVAFDLLLIPWPYALARFVRDPAEPWRRSR
ncbi:MAG TPA: hypothetical protein VEA60_06030 [Allosphingosinicella sp.]|nr:hypothetical protein [Allosphingosinicella sp.]